MDQNRYLVPSCSGTHHSVLFREVLKNMETCVYTRLLAIISSSYQDIAFFWPPLSFFLNKWYSSFSSFFLEGRWAGEFWGFMELHPSHRPLAITHRLDQQKFPPGSADVLKWCYTLNEHLEIREFFFSMSLSKPGCFSLQDTNILCGL